MNTRSRALAAGIAGLALTLTACGGGTGAKAASGSGSGTKKVTSIKLVAAEYSKDHTAAFWTQFAAAYKAKTGITLNVQVISWDDIDQQSSTMIQTNQAPDILNENAYASYAKDNLLYSSDDVLSPSVKSDLLPNFVKSGTYQGKMYGMPDLSSARALFYNKTLFTQAGITAPPTTWADFETDAKKVKALGNGDIGYAEPLGPEENQAEFSIWLFNNHGDWKTNGQWTINSPQNVQTLAFLKKLSVTDKVTQNDPAKTNRTDGAFPLFASGKAGMIVGFSPLAATLDAAKKVDYGVAPMPTSDGSAPQTYGVTDYLMAFKKAGNQAAVKAFYDLYYQPNEVNAFIKAEGFLPVTTSGVKQFADDPSLATYLQTLPNAHLTPTDDPNWDKVKIAVQQSLGAAVEPNGNPQTVLDALQKQAQAGELTVSHLDSGVSEPGSAGSLTPAPADRPGDDSGRSATAAAGTPAHRPANRAGLLGRFLGGSRPGKASTASALLWLAPSLILIVGVVIFPAIELAKASFSSYSIIGLREGGAGWSNYTAVLHDPALPVVLRNTLIWVVVVVGLTILISLGLAQFMAEEFVGRRLMRWAIIVPWAASLVITSRLFTLILDYNHGILNRLLVGLHILGHPIDWLGDDRFTLASMIGVGVFVSIPFTAYVLLAGLNAIPQDIYEAAKVDGAGSWAAYRHITLPLLRPAILVASVLNLIYVFNSFPVIYTLDDRNPGFSHDTSITYSYKLAFQSAEHSVGMSAAAGIFNVLLILLVVLAYLRLINWKEATQS